MCRQVSFPLGALFTAFMFAVMSRLIPGRLRLWLGQLDEAAEQLLPP